MGYASLAKEDVVIDHEAHQCLSEILKAGQRAKDLVRQILTFSRQQELSFSPFMIQPVIQEAAKLLRASIPSTIEMRLDLRADEALVFGDSSQIHQVLLNLTTNAAQAMRDRVGILSMSLTIESIDVETVRRFPDLKAGPYLKLAVSDTGIGIAPDVQERIFGPFFTTKPKGEPDNAPADGLRADPKHPGNPVQDSGGADDGIPRGCDCREARPHGNPASDDEAVHDGGHGPHGASSSKPESGAG
jgi:signal transduction histidine kinase